MNAVVDEKYLYRDAFIAAKTKDERKRGSGNRFPESPRRAKMNSTPKITCSAAEKQSAIGSTVNRIHSVMELLSDSIEYAESAFYPILRSAEQNNSPEDCRPIESDLHRELLNIEARAERALFAIDQLRLRSTI